MPCSQDHPTCSSPDNRSSALRARHPLLPHGLCEPVRTFMPLMVCGSAELRTTLIVATPDSGIAVESHATIGSVTEWAGIAAILLSLNDVVTGGFRVLRNGLPEAANAQGPTVQVFSGQPGTGGAGADVSVVATREDGRRLLWTVEVWIDRSCDGQWCATVKGEIDLADDDGGDRCVVNDQRTVRDGCRDTRAHRHRGELPHRRATDHAVASLERRRLADIRTCRTVRARCRCALVQRSSARSR